MGTKETPTTTAAAGGTTKSDVVVDAAASSSSSPTEPSSSSAAKPTAVAATTATAASTRVFKGLTILPPLQKKEEDGELSLSVDELKDAVTLPPLRAEEPVASLRGALSEVSGYAHLTNYRLTYLPSVKNDTTSAPATNGQDQHRSQTIPSPYTGMNAVVSLPSSFQSLANDNDTHDANNNGDDGNNKKEKEHDKNNKNELVLDDYGDLKPLVAHGLEDGACFRIVLERYDVGTVRDHVQRVRTLLNGNAPFVHSLLEEQHQQQQQQQKTPQNESDKNEKNKGTSGSTDADNEKRKDSPTTKLQPPEGTFELDPSKLQDFFYLACGEERPKPTLEATVALFEEDEADDERTKKRNGGKNKKKKNNSNNKTTTTSTTTTTTVSSGAKNDGRHDSDDDLARLNELDSLVQINCTVEYSGFHPPPPRRRLMGDLAYLEVTTPEGTVVHITACPTGFYVNSTKDKTTFDPSPATSGHCFSHELLDCLLQASKSFKDGWKAALEAAKERSELSATLNTEGAVQALHRMSCQVGKLDSVLMKPSWLVQLPTTTGEDDNGWTHNKLHSYNTTRKEEDLCSTYGLDIRSGMQRDWNEELQVAREMPGTNLAERIERARTIHKVMQDFGEAALIGTKAIFDGHISPMNPNEPTRSHVYLHNNIFFSRAVDSGVETFKMAHGDQAAKKSASRDAQCMGLLHRLDVSNIHTLATVLVDYLGTRFVCQSIVPGILQGEKTHQLLYGAVEATAPLSWDEATHQLLEKHLGATLMCATRKIATTPLTDDYIAEIEKIRQETAYFIERPSIQEPTEDQSPITTICGPVEAKGIKGSDQRTYLLDLTRVTPRDANWVPKFKGGTGKWESVHENDHHASIPADVDDDEWVMAVLRPELITHFVHKKMTAYMEAKESKEKENMTPEQASAGEGSDGDEKADGNKAKESKLPKKKTLTKEDEEHLASLRFNVNVFLPNLRSMEDLDAESVTQLGLDEARVREASTYLWDVVLPKLTRDIRDGIGHQLPADGRSLTELLHQRGINIRYIGRLAALAAEEEEKDKRSMNQIQSGKGGKLMRRTMPLSWQELLEVEMISRSAKHVLDSYLMENGGAGIEQPLQTVASFLCALVSESEETAGETETRVLKETRAGKEEPEDDDFNSLTILDTGGGGDALPGPVRGHREVWTYIEKEVGRRFRHHLRFFNRGSSSGRARYLPLLRRFCHRYGIRLVAKTYAIGGKCLCSGGSTSGGRLTASFPISPLDIVEINPLVKHAGALSGEGFVPTGSTSNSIASLHILLPDAKAAFEAAHYSYSARALPQALDLAQEAASLYQRVVDSPMHLNIARCLDLTAAILFDAQEPGLSAANAARALALTIQLGGFDCEEAMTGHSTLSHILLNSGKVAQGVKHLRAALFLMELLGGQNYSELANVYHKLGAVYHEAGNLPAALRCYREAASRTHVDRLAEGMMSKSMAVLLASMGKFKEAVETERKTFQMYSMLLGKDHELTKNSQTTLSSITRLAVEQGTKAVAAEQKRQQEIAADAMASQIADEEAVEEEKRKKKGGKKKKKK